MLKRVSKKSAKSSKGRFVIVAAKYNKRFTDSLVRHAKAALAEAKVADVEVVRVPGAFEVPVVAAHFAKRSEKPVSAIVCLAVVIQGETRHAQHVTVSATNALARLQVETGIPIINGIGLFDTVDQARVRCLSGEHNRGREAALTAIEMAGTMRKLAQKADQARSERITLKIV